MVSYKKMWIRLAEKEMKQSELRRKAEFSSATLTKLKNNEIVALSVLIRICGVLECDIGDVVEIKEAEKNDI